VQFIIYMTNNTLALRIAPKLLYRLYIMRINKGGKVLASGGFGCVFSPALKCEDTKNREKDNVSKLMTVAHAVEEYEEITSIKNKLDSIKDMIKEKFINELYYLILLTYSKLYLSKNTLAFENNFLKYHLQNTQVSNY
jgi:uncharacterized SAM-binding protein YcdF (DUF218 family)